MDHSCYFYLGLCHLQLNELQKVAVFFDKNIAQSVKEHGEDYIHFTDLMYLGIAEFELKNYVKAIVNFDNALHLQPQFCEVKYYKALCFSMMGNYEESQINLDGAKQII
ncbi:tetratricopeptide repeat protein [Psychroserpens sp.]|jgi:tetratricopeptide (TPR) repeat protein|uniref:tetratricopeptide repeat protein n=1 Tax=Psychroserpens sp. TaxID=2020870 RepID=UPI0039E2195D